LEQPRGRRAAAAHRRRTCGLQGDWGGLAGGVVAAGAAGDHARSRLQDGRANPPCAVRGIQAVAARQSRLGEAVHRPIGGAQVDQAHGPPRMTPDPRADPPRRNPWRRWLVEPVLRQLTQGITPQKISLTIAVGSALALFPILGTTTTLCALAGISLGLNQGIIQGVNALCFLVYFPLAVAFVRFGDALAGSAPSSLNTPLMMRL